MSGEDASDELDARTVGSVSSVVSLSLSKRLGFRRVLIPEGLMDAKKFRSKSWDGCSFKSFGSSMLALCDV